MVRGVVHLRDGGDEGGIPIDGPVGDVGVEKSDGSPETDCRRQSFDPHLFRVWVDAVQDEFLACDRKAQLIILQYGGKGKALQAARRRH